MTPEPTHTRPRPAAADAAGWALALAFVVICFMGLGSDGLNHGDVHTDERAVIGAVAFARAGHGELGFLQVEDLGHEFGIPPHFYARHPNGGVVVLGALLRAGWPLWWCRLPPLLATTLGLIGFWRYVRRSTGNPPLAALAMALLAVAAPFYLLSDSFQLYSWGIGVKGLAFPAIAVATTAWGTRRAGALSLLFLLCFAGVGACGLETMPAIGLMSVLHPLLVPASPLRSRLLLATAAATAAAGGMVAGMAARLPELIRVLGSFENVAAHLRTAVANRSLGEMATLPDGRSYPEEVLRRLVDYVPLHLALALLAFGVLIVGSLRSGTREPWRAARGALFACIVAEGLYYVFMRQHVSAHPHTTVHLAFSLAFGAAVALDALRRRIACWLPQPAANGMAAAVIAGSAFLFPTRTYSNLEGVGIMPVREKIFHAAIRVARGLPENVIVLVSEPARGEWTIRAGLALGGRTFVSSAPARWGGLNVFDLPVAPGRPVYVVTRGDSDPALDRLEADGVLVGWDGGISVFAYRNYDPASFPIVARGIDAADIKRGARTHPSDGDLAKAGVRYPIHGLTPRGFWFGAPPQNVGNETRFVLPMPARHGGEGRLDCAVRYEAEGGGKNQPTLVLGAEIVPSGESEELPLPIVREIDAGTPDVALSIPIPRGDSPRQVAFTLRRKEGDARASRPALEVFDLVFHHRPAPPRPASAPATRR